MKSVSVVRGWLSFAIGFVAAYIFGMGLVFVASGSWTYLHLIPVLMATVTGATCFAWGVSGFSPLTKGLIWLEIGTLIGYFLGLGINWIMQGTVNWVAPVASLFALLFGFTGFFLIQNPKSRTLPGKYSSD